MQYLYVVPLHAAHLALVAAFSKIGHVQRNFTDK